MVAAVNDMPDIADATRHALVTRREFDRLLARGAFEGRRFELIEGSLLDKMGQNPPHAFSVTALLKCLMRLFGVDRVRCQLPIEVAAEDSEFSYPEPDLAVISASVADSSERFEDRHPNGDELNLIVEVADATSRLDRTVKAGLYARAGVPEYWVLDVTTRTLHLYRQPKSGVYTQTVTASTADVVSPGSIPDAVVAVAELLPRVRGASAE